MVDAMESAGGHTPSEASSSGTPDEPDRHRHECDGCRVSFWCDCSDLVTVRGCYKCQERPSYWRLREARRRGLAYWLGGALAVLLMWALLSPAGAHAAETTRGWQTTALFLSAEAALVLDLGQTIDRGAGRAGPERNPLLGDRPGRAVAWAYFGSLLAAEAATWWLAPRWVSRTVSLVTLAIEVPVVTKNFQVGVRVRF